MSEDIDKQIIKINERLDRAEEKIVADFEVLEITRNLLQEHNYELYVRRNRQIYDMCEAIDSLKKDIAVIKGMIVVMKITKEEKDE